MSVESSTLQHAHERGFTLIELLVALVAASLLAAMILAGADLAARRSRTATLQQGALQLATRLIETRVAERNAAAPIDPDAQGSEGPLSWSASTRELMADPRGLHSLIEYRIEVSNVHGDRLAELSRRILVRKAVP